MIIASTRDKWNT